MTISAKQKRFLVIRAGNIGDVLMSTPVSRKLKKVFPDCRVDFVTAIHARAVLEANTSVDNIFIFGKYKRMGGSFRKFLLERSLAGNKYDACFVLEQHVQYHQFAKNIMGSRGLTVGLASEPATNYLDHTLAYDHHEQHAIDSALDLLRKFLNIPIDEDDYLMDFFIPDEVEQTLKRSLPDWKGAEGKYVVIHPGSSEYFPFRGWVMVNYIPVVRFLRAQGYRVFLTGTRSEKNDINGMMKNLGHDDPGVEIFLDRPLFDMAFLIRQASGVLSPDTGILHLARAMRTPVVALFGPSNPKHTGCTGPGEYVQIRNDFKCGPCNYSPQYRLEDKKNCLDGQPPACMKSITIEQVKDGFKKILDHG